MLLGFNMLLWASQVTDEHFPLLGKLKAAGYDGVELPLFEGTPEIYERVGLEISNNGLRATAVCVIPDAEHDCTSAHSKVRAAGLAHLKWAIDCLQAAGGEVLCGPYYQPLASFSGEPPTLEERSHIVEVHKQAARYAARANIKLAVEPLDRSSAMPSIRSPTPPTSSNASASRTTACSTTPSTPISRRRTRLGRSLQIYGPSTMCTRPRTTGERRARPRPMDCDLQGAEGGRV